MLTDEQVLARILFRLLNNRCFRKGHMLAERVVSSVPTSERGQAKSILKDAIRKGLICVYGKTTHGEAYQLNIERLNEITEIIRTNYKTEVRI